jgi:hypothetical protein
MRPRALVHVLLLALLGGLQPQLGASSGEATPAPSPSDPWSRLAHLRHELAAQHLAADFTQTFRPAGFEQGEKESGALYLALPDCLRWEYREPEAKSFLICGPDLYAWISGDTHGHHTVIEPRNEPGLDLLLLSLDVLRLRYDIAQTGETIDLRPRDPQNAIRQASFLLDGRGTRLTALEYTDLEGNWTRFDLANWRPLTDRSLFDPPSLRWTSE